MSVLMTKRLCFANWLYWDTGPRALTFKAILTEALVLIFSTKHAVTTIQAGPAVTGAVVYTLANGSAFCEAVGQIHLLVVDGNLSRQRTDIWATTQRQIFGHFCFISFISTERSHLSYTSLEHFADIGRLRQDVHVGDSAQVHGSVDIEALGFSWRCLPFHWALVDPQVAGPLIPFGHNSVPLTQRDWLLTQKDCLAWKSQIFYWLWKCT